MKIAIESDHAGFKLKEIILNHLNEKYDLIDMGTHSMEAVDYPCYAEKMARLVASDSANLGILICGTDIGVSVSANKIHGIRAALVSG